MNTPLYRYINIQIFALLFLVMGMVGEGYGQTKIYATNYGKNESGAAIPVVQAEGRVNNPTNAIGNTVNFAEVKVGLGLLGGAYANLQLKFINPNLTNLPAGTPIYVRLDNGATSGLLGLGLLLASKGLVSAYRDSDPINSNTSISGVSVPILIDEKMEGAAYYLIITPQQCFNSIEISIKSGGLLGLLSSGNIRIYHAYYECPEIIVNPTSVCQGESVKLKITTPLSTECGQKYLWYTQISGGSPLANSNPFSSELDVSPSSTTTYWVEYNGIDNSKCGRTPVIVTVKPKPPAPVLNINPNSQY